jgi:hypothetical protein
MNNYNFKLKRADLNNIYAEDWSMILSEDGLPIYSDWQTVVVTHINFYNFSMYGSYLATGVLDEASINVLSEDGFVIYSN